MISKNRLAFAAISAGLVTSLLGMGAAQADPTGAPVPRALVGVGSDTVQDVENQIANDVIFNGVKQLGSYNATGSATFDTGKAGCSAVTRPNGSGAGRAALLNSLNGVAPYAGCIQYARSSSLTLTASSPALTYIPFAIDAVSFAVTANSSLGRSFSLADLSSIYHCDPNFVGSGPNYDVTPILPQAGSGTRSYWEGQMGITDADVNNNVYPCIINGVKNGVQIEEHSGTVLDNKSIVPFSIGQYTDQANGLSIDKRGSAVLGVIAGTDPQLINPNFSVKRDVYNVIASSNVNVSPYSDVFVGAASKVCQDSATILHYGFAVNPNCGSTSNHN